MASIRLSREFVLFNAAIGRDGDGRSSAALPGCNANSAASRAVGSAGTATGSASSPSLSPSSGSMSYWDRFINKHESGLYGFAPTSSRVSLKVVGVLVFEL